MLSIKKITILLSLIILAFSLSVEALLGQQQKVSDDNVNKGQEPIVDYESSQPSTPEEAAKRKAKDGFLSKKTLAESPNAQVFVTIRGTWLERLPSFPVSLSDTIIIGSVSDGRAYLSANKTGVFSEFNIQIEEVLKQSSDSFLAAGNSIIAEREGGRVRYPSGHIQRYVILHQGMPVVGKRYVFFLRKADQTAEVAPYILTGYELRAGHVFPIDGVDGNNEEKLSQFTAYEGADEGAFLGELRGAIAKIASKEGK